MSESLPFYVVNAFTTDLFRGNPAAVVFVDSLDNDELLQGLAVNLNQPMTAFLRQATSDDAEPLSTTFDVRWFTSGGELPLCGHATVASSGLMFSSPGMLNPIVEIIRYKTRGGLTLTARKNGSWVDVSLDAAEIQSTSVEETARLSGIVRTALGKNVTVHFVGTGLGVFSEYLLVEIDVADVLENCKPLHNEFVSISRYYERIRNGSQTCVSSRPADASTSSRRGPPIPSSPTLRACSPLRWEYQKILSVGQRTAY